MKRILIIFIVFTLIVSTIPALAVVKHDGYDPYGVDNYAFFVPSTWTASKGQSGNTVFSSGSGDDLSVFMSVDIAHPSSIDYDDPEDIDFLYEFFLRSIGISDLTREDVDINGRRAILWSNITDDGTHTSGLSYITSNAMINIYYMCYTPGHEDDTDLLLDIASKIISLDEYYAG